MELKSRLELLKCVSTLLSQYSDCESETQLDELHEKAVRLLANGYLDGIVGSKTYELWYSRAYKLYLVYGLVLSGGDCDE